MRSRPLLRAAATCIALTSVLFACWTAGAVADPAQHAGQVAAGGEGVGAILSYQEGVGGPLPYTNLRLRISRAGVSVYEQPVSSRYCGTGCVPQALGFLIKSSPLAVTDLEGNGQPSVTLELSTGGAHCCTVVQVFAFDPGVMAYRLIERDFGDPGALLTRLGNGPPVFESADDRFAYEFAPYAYSGLPLQVWSFRGGRFVNSTRSFPKAIASDAKRQLRGFAQTRAQGLGLGLIAAWAADEDLLGHARVVSSTLAREARAHRLRSREGYGPSGSAFIAKLQRFLRSNGYR
jgi:hypothetical protein